MVLKKNVVQTFETLHTRDEKLRLHRTTDETTSSKDCRVMRPLWILDFRDIDVYCLMIVD